MQACCVPQLEALYIHNFEEGMRDAQMAHLTRVLKKGHIWALNVGENFRITRRAWEIFAERLQRTNVTHLYVSEQNVEQGAIMTKALPVETSWSLWLKAMKSRPSCSGSRNAMLCRYLR